MGQAGGRNSIQTYDYFWENANEKPKMKKIIPFIFLFILFLTVFISFAYARQRNLKPSDVAINNAISWAQSQVLQPSFSVFGTDVIIWSTFRCVDFVANAYGYPAISYTAGLFWAVSVVQHPGDWNAPRGSLVFFSPNSYNKGMGHVALSTGNGNLIEAGYDLVIRSTIRDEGHTAPYLGWAWPPLIWPGRSDVLMATVKTWAIQAGKAVILTIACWLAFLFIKSKVARRRAAPGDRPAHQPSQRDAG